MGTSGSGVGLSFSFFCCLLILFFIPHPTLSVRVCKPASCREGGLEPQVRFPFRLEGKQEQRCGYPGFDLACNNNGRTILTLPRSGDFIVNWISYSTQTIYLDDPGSCLPNRISSFNVVGSSFRAAPDKYAFFNCSSRLTAYPIPENAVPLFCLHDFNFTILTMPKDYLSGEIPPPCRLMPNVSFPLHLSYFRDFSETLVEEDLKLVWDEPAGCRSCEQREWYCGFKSDSGLETGCARPPRRGLPRSAKYGVIIGVGIPGLMCLIGIACYVCGKVRDFGRRRNLNAELSPTAVNPQVSVTVTGLDAPTIESFPKTVLGGSGRLPNPSDSTCSICLSEYQPKETLRSIPECNHYFHASCVDEWLKLNGTCPVCRSSPENMSATPCSSMSSTFSISSSA